MKKYTDDVLMYTIMTLEGFGKFFYGLAKLIVAIGKLVYYAIKKHFFQKPKKVKK